MLNTNVDAFNNLIAVPKLTLFDVTQLSNDINSVLMTSGVVSGTGSVTYNQNKAATILSIPPNTTGRVLRRSRRHFKYQAGKGQAITLTGIFGNAIAGVTKRIGYFDDDDGIFFEQNINGFCLVVRSSVSGIVEETKVYREDWNGDAFDNEATNHILKENLGQIFYIDFEWLGLGQVRFAIFEGGKPYFIHFEDFSNASQSVYMKRPNLPVAYEIESDGTNPVTAELESICVSVESQGGQNETGITRYISRGASAITTPANTNLIPLISVRLGANYHWDTVYPISIDVACSSASAEYEVIIVYNPTIGGADLSTWVPLTSSGIEYNITRTNTNLVSGGIQLSGMVTAQDRASQSVLNIPVNNFLALGSSFLGDSDELVVAARSLSGTAETFYANIVLRELF